MLRKCRVKSNIALLLSLAAEGLYCISHGRFRSAPFRLVRNQLLGSETGPNAITPAMIVPELTGLLRVCWCTEGH